MFDGPTTIWGWIGFWLMFTIIYCTLEWAHKRFWRWRYQRAVNAYAAAKLDHEITSATLSQTVEASPYVYRKTIRALKRVTKEP